VRRRGDGARRDVERFCGLGLRQSQNVAADDHLALALAELRKFDEKIDLVVAADHVSTAAKCGQRPEQPSAPAVPFP
jgi:hypothetical protein